MTFAIGLSIFAAGFGVGCLFCGFIMGTFDD